MAGRFLLVSGVRNRNRGIVRSQYSTAKRLQNPGLDTLDSKGYKGVSQGLAPW